MMGKYTNLESNVHSIFASVSWKAQGVITVPANYAGNVESDEYIRISIVSSGLGYNLHSVSGMLMIDIFTRAGEGPRRSSVIADLLDSYLVGRTISPTSGVSVQMMGSSVSQSGPDKDNPALNRAIYAIPFNYSEVL
jgi:hypothetical protein